LDHGAPLSAFAQRQRCQTFVAVPIVSGPAPQQRFAALLALASPVNAQPYPAEPEIPEWATLYKTLADCQPTPTTETGAKCLKAVGQFYAVWVNTPPEIREKCIGKADETRDALKALGQTKPHTLWACIEVEDKACFGDGAQGPASLSSCRSGERRSRRSCGRTRRGRHPSLLHEGCRRTRCRQREAGDLGGASRIRVH
jgi:hypothetical protein